MNKFHAALVAGKRGAGKTTAVILAIHSAARLFMERGVTIIPVVINASSLATVDLTQEKDNAINLNLLKIDRYLYNATRNCERLGESSK
jgi:hypothetical protein